MKARAPTRTGSHLAPAEARWSEQRQRLLQAAQRAIHRDGPQISMDEIAAEAGITKPIVYRHFGDRRGLARALRDSAFGLMVGAPSDDTPSNRRVARERIAAFYPVVSDPDHLRRVVVGWATGFQMFVEMNRNLYGFLRAEGVMDSMWEESDANMKEPVAESLAASLRAVFADRGIEQATAEIWAHALRGMVREIVHWSTTARAYDRFELERQIDLLAGVLIDGFGRALAAQAPLRGRGRSAAVVKTTKPSTASARKPGRAAPSGKRPRARRKPALAKPRP